jgi:DNA mismatch repair protein MutS2
LKYAKKRIGENEQAVDELLVDLQREKQEYDEKLKLVAEKQGHLEHLIKQYDDQVKDIEFRRKKLKLDAKELELQKSSQTNQELKKLVKELKQEKNVEKAQQIVQEVRIQQTRLAEEFDTLSEDVYTARPALEKPILVGSTVKMRAGSATGIVEILDKKEATLRMGEMRVTVKLKDLIAVGEQIEIKRTPSVTTDAINRSATFDGKVDIRGMSMFDADKALEEFMDRAVVSSANSVHIVHGKGSGVLQKVVKKKLKEYKQVKRFFHPEHNEGGDGATVVEF